MMTFSLNTTDISLITLCAFEMFPVSQHIQSSASRRTFMLDSSDKTSILSSLCWLLIDTRCDFKVHLPTHEIQVAQLSLHHIFYAV